MQIEEADVHVIQHRKMPRTVEKEKVAARTARDTENVVMAPIVVVAAQD